MKCLTALALVCCLAACSSPPPMVTVSPEGNTPCSTGPFIGQPMWFGPDANAGYWAVRVGWGYSSSSTIAMIYSQYWPRGKNAGSPNNDCWVTFPSGWQFPGSPGSYYGAYRLDGTVYAEGASAQIWMKVHDAGGYGYGNPPEVTGTSCWVSYNAGFDGWYQMDCGWYTFMASVYGESVP